MAQSLAYGGRRGVRARWKRLSLRKKIVASALAFLVLAGGGVALAIALLTAGIVGSVTVRPVPGVAWSAAPADAPSVVNAGDTECSVAVQNGQLAITLWNTYGGAFCDVGATYTVIGDQPLIIQSVTPGAATGGLRLDFADDTCAMGRTTQPGAKRIVYMRLAVPTSTPPGTYTLGADAKLVPVAATGYNLSGCNSIG